MSSHSNAVVKWSNAIAKLESRLGYPHLSQADRRAILAELKPARKKCQSALKSHSRKSNK